MSELKHTPEPWINDGDVRVQGNSDGHRLDIAFLYPTPLHLESVVSRLANAQRIVACVNACKGMTDNYLIEHLELLDQRDKLVEIANAAERALRINECPHAANEIRAAIAEVEQADG